MLDSTTKHPQNRIHIFDPVSLITNNSDRGVHTSFDDVTVTPKSHGNIREINLQQGLKPNDIRGLTTITNDREISSYGHHKSDKNEGLGIRLGVEKRNDLEYDENDDSTPRLWNSMNNSSAFRPGSPMSPSSRTRAIAKGRRELMDMVKDLPESYYELSLKDIVEHKAEIEVEKGVIINITEEKTTPQESSKLEEVKKTVNQNAKKVKKSESNKKMVRSGSVDNGKFLLRTSFFPIFSSSKKNKKNLGGSNSLKIVPMAKSRGLGGPVTSESDASNGMISSKSGSSGSSSSSSRSSIDPRRLIQRFLPTWCFFNGKRITAKK